MHGSLLALSIIITTSILEDKGTVLCPAFSSPAQAGLEHFRAQSIREQGWGDKCKVEVGGVT